jgi:O-antigen/teichoic acid export membrane protein
MKIPEATGTVMFPRLAGSVDRDAHVATTRVVRYTLFILAIGVAAFGVGGPIAIPLLYGSRFNGAIKPLLILLPGIFMMALYQLLTRNFTSRGKQEINIVAACVALTLNVTLNIFLIPRYGISGAALANGISYSTAALTLLVAFVRDSGHSVRETLLVRPTEIGDIARAARKMAGRLPGRKAA